MDNPEKLGVRERFLAYFRNKPEMDSGAQGPFAKMRGMRANFGNYNFNSAPGPQPGANFSPYFSNPVKTQPRGMRRIFRDGKNKVTV